MSTKCQMVFWLLVLNLLHKASCLFDPISIGIGAGIGLGAFNYGFLKDQTYCRMYECCNERSIPANITALRERLENNLFGQHIVLQHLLPALSAHFSEKSFSRKPLVISFHGTQGTGKNYVADMIAESLYLEGLRSRFVHKFLGRADFSSSSSLYTYKERINREVLKGIEDCPRSLFIFDEVDKMPQGVFDSLTSLVEYNALPNRLDSSKAIFIFISNTAGVHISDRLATLIMSGTIREEAKLSEFEQTVKKAAYNMDGGLQKTSMIEAHVIDHYLPFLPLEKKHVFSCIEVVFKWWGINPDPATIDLFIQENIVYDRDHGLFATSGCKTIEKKVAVQVIKLRQKSIK